ncbi:hypothetical protein SETIT_3G234700v2 [Setaria italica]|uniref:Uncharacterized protein n=1 Tax=Setaria italica TaxID=4555 RepID=A0A368QI46_SETIT|nr:hypothetical protein SETIT_3G234700v2 [Setaria italica]
MDKEKNPMSGIMDLKNTLEQVVIHELLFSIRWPDLKAITEKYDHPKTMVSPQDIPSSFFEDCNK